jgi:superfamily II RNA helicase
MSKHPAYDVAKNLAEANLPSNVQLEKGLENTKEALEAQMKQKGSWAPEYKLAKDTTELLDTTKQFIEEKNRGELLQQFIKDSGEALQETQDLFNTQQFWIERNKLFQFGAKPITDIKQMSQLNVESLKNLVLTLVNSGDFRALVNEFLELVQVMAKTEEQKTGGLPSFKPETVSNVPLTEEAKQKAEQTKEVAQKLFQDIKEGKITIPEDRKQLVFERLRTLVNKINADPNYQKRSKWPFPTLRSHSVLGYKTQRASQGTGRRYPEIICYLAHVE